MPNGKNESAIDLGPLSEVSRGEPEAISTHEGSYTEPYNLKEEFIKKFFHDFFNKPLLKVLTSLYRIINHF